MLKLFKCPIVAGTVLIAGLSSCSSDKKESDVYKPSAPQVIKTQGTSDLRTFDNSPNKDLEFTDALDFSGTGAARVQIKTQCQSKGQVSNNEISVSQPGTIVLATVLPSEIVYSQNLKEAPASCTFALNLFNENGSNHVFILQLATVRETLNSTSILETNASLPAISPNDIPIWDPQTLRSVRLRTHRGDHDLAQLICEDYELPAKEIGFIQDLGSFDIRKFDLRPGHVDTSIILRPIQTCRVATFVNGQPGELSAKFRLRLGISAPLSIALEPSPDTRCQGLDCVNFGNELEKHPYVLHTWKITNPNSVPRYFRFTDKKQSIRVRYINFGTSSLMYRDLPIEILKSADDNSTQITISPGQSIRVAGIIQMDQMPQSCVGSSGAYAFIDFPFDLHIEETNSQGEYIGDAKLTTPNSVNIYPIWRSQLQQLHEAQPCP